MTLNGLLKNFYEDIPNQIVILSERKSVVLFFDFIMEWLESLFIKSYVHDCLPSSTLLCHLLHLLLLKTLKKLALSTEYGMKDHFNFRTEF